MSKKNEQIASDINYDDLCNLIALEIGNTSPQKVKKFLRATYVVILRQLQLNNRIFFKNFGAFEIRQRQGGERVVGDFEGGSKLVYVKPKNSISFKPSEIFDISVNENNFKIARNTNQRRKKKREKDNDISKTVVDIINKAEERKKR